MKNLEILLTRRSLIRQLFDRWGVRGYVISATGGHLGIEIEFDSDEDHFERLDGLCAELRRLGLRFSKYASGIELRYLAHPRDGRRGAQIVFEIVSHYKAFFSFWEIVDEETGARRILDDEEEEELARTLRYRAVRLDGYEVIVDGLVSRDPSATISTALDALYHRGSDDELAMLHRILRAADRPPARPSASQRKLVDDAVRALAKHRSVFSLKRARSEPRNCQLISHVYGKPYFERGDAWPLNPKTKRPLDFIFQIVDARGRVLPEGISILQLYYDLDQPPWESRTPGWCVRTYAKVDRRRVVPRAAPEELEQYRFAMLELVPDQSLPEWSQLHGSNDRARRNVVALCKSIGSGATEAVYTRAAKRIMKRGGAWSFLGGYPRRLQDEPRSPNRRARFLLQLGSDSKLDLMWGDCGVMYLFYDPTTARFSFEVQSL